MYGKSQGQASRGSKNEVTVIREWRAIGDLFFLCGQKKNKQTNFEPNFERNKSTPTVHSAKLGKYFEEQAATLRCDDYRNGDELSESIRRCFGINCYTKLPS